MQWENKKLNDIEDPIVEGNGKGGVSVLAVILSAEASVWISAGG